MLRRVCIHFNKRREWSDAGSSAAGPTARIKLEKPILARTEETRRWIESDVVPTDVVKGPSQGTALEELTKMVRDLQIAQARRDSGE